MAYVQSASISSDGTTSTTVAVTFGSNVTAGNLIALFVVFNSGANIIDTVADSLGNTYVLADTAVGFAGDSHATYYAKNITGGACTVTVTLTASVGYRSLVVHEASGLDTTAPLDQHVINTQTTPGTGANAVTSGSVTTTTDGQYIFGATHVNNVGAGVTVTPGTGLTGRESIDGGADSAPLESEDLIQTSAGAIAATFTQSVDNNVTTAIMTFKAAGGGATAWGPLLALQNNRLVIAA